MRDLDMTTLRLFVAVCEQHSIARAGEAANIVGSAISKRLAALEDTVGMKLLVRGRRGVAPTPAGEALLDHARAILGNVARIERDIGAFSSGVKGQVRILATASVLAASLAEDVATFLHDPAHADIRVDMEEGLSHHIIRGVRDGVASLGMCWDAADFLGLACLPYGGDRLAVAVHPKHPLARYREVSLTDTLDHEQVTLPDASAVTRTLMQLARQSGKTLMRRVIVSNLDSAMRVVGANLAIAIVPTTTAQYYAASKAMRVVALTDDWADRRFALCFRGEGELSAAARLLRDHLVAARAPAAAPLDPS